MGFTAAMIRDLLPNPIEKPSPMYSSAAPMKLWPRDVVDEVMRSAEFARRKALADKRKASAAKGVAKKRGLTKEHFDWLISGIEVETIPIEEVREFSLEDRRLFLESRNRFDEFPENAPESVQERWAVNFIRHRLTNYDEGLWNAKGEVGINEEYSRYKAAVLDAISNAYPALQDECRRQKTLLRTGDC